MRRRLLTLATAILAVFGIATAPAVGEEDDWTYRLDSGAEVRVTVFKEPDMSGDFRVDMDGTMSIPGVGEIPARGLTSEELKQAIATAMTERNLANPQVSVQINDFGNVFVMGDVRNPGTFAYAAGLTVLQLVAISGGYSLAPAAVGGTSARDISSMREELAVLTVRQDRLRAEMEERLELLSRPGLETQVGKLRLDQILATETELLKLHVEEPREKIRKLRRQQEQIDQEIEALQMQMESNRKLLAIVESELSTMRKLREQGIAANPRVLELERLSVDTDLKMNSTAALISASRQNRTEIDLRVQTIEEEVRTRALESLIQTNTDIAVLKRHIADREFLAVGDEPVADGAVPLVERTFLVSRPGEDEPFAATAATAIRPGDVLTVGRQDNFERLGFPGDTSPVLPTRLGELHQWSRR